MLASRVQPKDTRSRFERWLDTLTPEHREIVDGWLSDPAVTNKAIADAIRADDEEDGFHGIAVTVGTIATYRNALRGN